MIEAQKYFKKYCFCETETSVKKPEYYNSDKVSKLLSENFDLNIHIYYSNSDNICLRIYLT